MHLPAVPLPENTASRFWQHLPHELVRRHLERQLQQSVADELATVRRQERALDAALPSRGPV